MIGLFGRRRRRERREALNDRPRVEGNLMVMPRVEVSPDEVDLGGMPAAEQPDVERIAAEAFRRGMEMP